MEDGLDLDTIFEYTNIDPWFLNQLRELHQAETWLRTKSLPDLSADDLLQSKRRGFSDLQLATFTGAALNLVSTYLAIGSGFYQV